MPATVEVGGVEGALHHRQAERVGDAGVGVEGADARSRRREAAGAARRASTPWPTSAASRRDVGLERAGRLDEREGRDRRDVGRVERQPPGRRRGARSCATEPVSRFGPTRDDEAGDRPPLARDGDVAGEVEHQAVERARRRRGCR